MNGVCAHLQCSNRAWHRGVCRLHYERLMYGAGHTSRGRPPRRQQVTEEVAWLIGWDHPASIAARLGYKTVKALTASLHHWGEHTLATRLHADWTRQETAVAA